MKEFWNQRYAEPDYVYGTQPNQFFKEVIDTLVPGTMLLPCEGEGRNAVYAASIGWQVDAFDFSLSGKQKAEALARQEGVQIQYTVTDALDFHYPDNTADAVAFIYAHYPPQVRTTIHRKAIQWLKPGGVLILEAFNPAQLGRQSGGPKDLNMLYAEAILREDFEGMDIELLQTLRVNLSEGAYHAGEAEVIRLVARKPL